MSGKHNTCVSEREQGAHDERGYCHGWWRGTWEDGTTWYVCHFTNGYLDGAYESYHRNGRPHRKLTCKMGKTHGRHQRWDANGNLELDEMYEDGEPVVTSAK